MVKKICVNVKMGEIDKVIYEAKKGEWQLVKRGKKYLYFRKGFITAKIDKKRYENFNEENIIFEIWITVIEEFMHSTYLYCKGKKEICRGALDKIKKEYGNDKDIKLEIKGVAI